MRLSQEIIYYWLVKKTAVRFEKKNENKTGFKRPVFYENGLMMDETIVIIDGKGLKELMERHDYGSDTLFICTDKVNRSLKMLDGTVLLVESKLSTVSLFNYLQEIFNRFDQWDERLNQIFYENGSFQDLVDSCEPILSQQILLIDKGFHYPAHSKFLKPIGGTVFMDEFNNSLPDIVNDFISDSSFQSLYECPDVFDYSVILSTGLEEMICKNVFDQGDYVGRFIIQLTDACQEYEKSYIRHILAHLFVTADKLYQKYQSFDLKEVALNSLREPLIQALNNVQGSDDQWHKAAFENHWQVNDRLQLVQFRSNTRYAKNVYTDYLSSQIESQWQACVCLNSNDRFLMLVNLDQFKSEADRDFYRQLPLFLRESLLVAGLSRVFHALADLPAAYQQTDIALDYGGRSQPMFWIHHFNDHAFTYLLKNGPGAFSLHQICSEKLLRLRQNDTTKHTDYYNTLRIFFDCRLNAAAAAKALYIHRSSFLNRLERMAQLFKIDFDSNEELLYLGLSMLIIERN